MRRYYSQRKNGASIKLNDLNVLLQSCYSQFEAKGYFQEAFGFYCVDQGDVAGYAGDNPSEFVLLRLRKQNLWPFSGPDIQWEEEDIFDIIELLHDTISKPTEGTYHSYNNCGYHYSKFDSHEGQLALRNEINSFLSDYPPGFELTPKGEIEVIGEPGLRELWTAGIPSIDEKNVTARVNIAIQKFRSRHSNSDERREAVRALSDVLEFLRPKIKLLLNQKDESELFKIANNYAIRHHNERQKREYDPVWLSWIFYFYLSTIHLCTRLIAEKNL